MAGLFIVAPRAFAAPQPGSPSENCNGNGNHNGQGVCARGLLVTIAARECHDYQDIRANLARNNIMESLEDLGADTPYQLGESINPQKEIEGQPKCKPITGWRFTLGSGIQGRAVSGPWGSLSIVTGADPTEVITQASIPLRGFDGEPIAGHAISGATTIELTQAQAERASRNNLWIQGGTPQDPMLYGESQFTGKYGFGALRCSIDNLNGDNVETIAFPTGTRHAFCYAYYVTPPPSSGKIIIRKEVRGSGPDPQAFRFTGNLSYNEGGVFGLSAAAGSPGEATFYRAETRQGDEPWTAIEEVPKGWHLTAIDCDSSGSRIEKNVTKATVAIALKAGDTVTCTYVDRLTPPAGALLLRKLTVGGVGAFRFRILDDSGDAVKERSIETKREGTAAYARPIKLKPGEYRVLEHSPTDPRGVWRLVAVSCNGRERSTSASVGVRIAAGKGVLCSFTNRLSHPGQIRIIKEALGNTGTAAFQITSHADPTLELRQVAKVKKEGVPVPARGDSSRGLPFGAYVIEESGGQEAANGSWALVEVLCNGESTPFEQGRARVRLTHGSPRASCRFVNRFTPGPVVPPEPPGPAPLPGGPEPDLSVEKQLVSTSTGPTPEQTFRITVKNQGPVAAEGVLVIDEPGPGLAILSARPSQGSCTGVGRPSCDVASIPPGGRVTILVKTRDYASGATYNRAIVGSASAEAGLANDQATASVAPIERVIPGGACGSALSLVRARC